MCFFVSTMGVWVRGRCTCECVRLVENPPIGHWEGKRTRKGSLGGKEDREGIFDV